MTFSVIFVMPMTKMLTGYGLCCWVAIDLVKCYHISTCPITPSDGMDLFKDPTTYLKEFTVTYLPKWNCSDGISDRLFIHNCDNNWKHLWQILTPPIHTLVSLLSLLPPLWHMLNFVSLHLSHVPSCGCTWSSQEKKTKQLPRWNLTPLSYLLTHHRYLKGPVIHRSGAFTVQSQASPCASLST